MRVKFLIVILLFVSNLSFSKELSDFEKMLSGFPECRFDGLYVDSKSRVPAHNYLKIIDPYFVDEEFGIFYYKVDETFYGLSVIEMVVPVGFHGVFGVVFNEDMKIVKDKLNKFLSYGYNKQTKDDSPINVPFIDYYSMNKTKVIMYCNFDY